MLTSGQVIDDGGDVSLSCLAYCGEQSPYANCSSGQVQGVAPMCDCGCCIPVCLWGLGCGIGGEGGGDGDFGAEWEDMFWNDMWNNGGGSWMQTTWLCMCHACTNLYALCIYACVAGYGGVAKGWSFDSDW